MSDSKRGNTPTSSTPNSTVTSFRDDRDLLSNDMLRVLRDSIMGAMNEFKAKDKLSQDHLTQITQLTDDLAELSSTDATIERTREAYRKFIHLYLTTFYMNERSKTFGAVSIGPGMECLNRALELFRDHKVIKKAKDERDFDLFGVSSLTKFRKDNIYNALMNSVSRHGVIASEVTRNAYERFKTAMIKRVSGDKSMNDLAERFYIYGKKLAIGMEDPEQHISTETWNECIEMDGLTQAQILTISTQDVTTEQAEQKETRQREGSILTKPKTQEEEDKSRKEGQISKSYDKDAEVMKSAFKNSFYPLILARILETRNSKKPGGQQKVVVDNLIARLKEIERTNKPIRDRALQIKKEVYLAFMTPFTEAFIQERTKKYHESIDTDSTYNFLAQAAAEFHEQARSDLFGAAKEDLLSAVDDTPIFASVSRRPDDEKSILADLAAKRACEWAIKAMEVIDGAKKQTRDDIAKVDQELSEKIKNIVGEEKTPKTDKQVKRDNKAIKEQREAASSKKEKLQSALDKYLELQSSDIKQLQYHYVAAADALSKMGSNMLSIPVNVKDQGYDAFKAHFKALLLKPDSREHILKLHADLQSNLGREEKIEAKTEEKITPPISRRPTTYTEPVTQSRRPTFIGNIGSNSNATNINTVPHEAKITDVLSTGEMVSEPPSPPNLETSAHAHMRERSISVKPSAPPIAPPININVAPKRPPVQLDGSAADAKSAAQRLITEGDPKKRLKKVAKDQDVAKPKNKGLNLGGINIPAPKINIPVKSPVEQILNRRGVIDDDTWNEPSTSRTISSTKGTWKKEKEESKQPAISRPSLSTKTNTWKEESKQQPTPRPSVSTKINNTWKDPGDTDPARRNTFSTNTNKGTWKLEQEQKEKSEAEKNKGVRKFQPPRK